MNGPRIPGPTSRETLPIARHMTLLGGHLPYHTRHLIIQLFVSIFVLSPGSTDRTMAQLMNRVAGNAAFVGGQLRVASCVNMRLPARYTVARGKSASGLKPERRCCNPSPLSFPAPPPRPLSHHLRTRDIELRLFFVR